MSPMPGRLGLGAAVAAILLYLIFPVIVVVAISFSAGNFLVFPPPGLSLRWYRSIASDPEWVSALWVTVKVGGLSALIATAARRARRLRAGALRDSRQGAVERAHPVRAGDAADRHGALDLPVLRPARTGQHRRGLAFAHAVSGMPFVVINAAASLRSADINLERAAVIHGAHPLWAVLRITLPIISPGIVIGGIFAFVHSTHELLVAMFVLGGVGKPVAVKIWSGVQATSDPTIAAASAILIGLAILTFASAAATQSLAKRRSR